MNVFVKDSEDIGQGQTMNYFRELISKDECELIVRNALKSSDALVIEYNISKIPGHIGFLGEYLRLKVLVERNGVQSRERYFLKSLPIADKNQRSMMESLGFFRKEVGVYSQILNAFGHNATPSKWRPNCYLTRNDLIVLEDLTWQQGFSMLDTRMALRQSHLHLVLDALSQMHGLSLNYEYNCVSGQRLDELHADVLFETSVIRDNSWFMAGLSGIKAIALNGTKYCRDPAKKQIMEQLMDSKLNQVFEVIKPTYDFQSVLIHRDIWLNNLMFQLETNSTTDEDNLNSPKSCILLDFQICRYLPPIIDFLLTLYLTTRRSHRDDFFQEYLNFYYERLSNKMRGFNLDPDTILSRSQLDRSIGHYKIIGHVFAGVYLALTNLPANVLDQLHRDDPDLYHQYCNGNRDEFLLKYLRDDEFYRETMTECVEETVEFFFGFEKEG
ncbi:uncharacterized protein LOC134218073 [Armigeres subalbatus]|uniref:uncharacterized protein LOC134218073 n=1 Tax=Armigeres subalbatus TaxID=124917 RepID=UPI002ED1AD2D